MPPGQAGGGCAISVSAFNSGRKKQLGRILGVRSFLNQGYQRPRKRVGLVVRPSWLIRLELILSDRELITGRILDRKLTDRKRLKGNQFLNCIVKHGKPFSPIAADRRDTSPAIRLPSHGRHSLTAPRRLAPLTNPPTCEPLLSEELGRRDVDGSPRTAKRGAKKVLLRMPQAPPPVAENMSSTSLATSDKPIAGIARRSRSWSVLTRRCCIRMAL